MADEIKPQRIIKLQSTNIKRLSAVAIYPDGNTVIIGGANNEGKSSVLDSICMVLGGKNFVPERPIRDGKTKAEIVAELDDLIVTRTFTQSGGTTLKVTTKEGAPLSSPQGILDKLIGRLSFDPLDFSRMAEKEPQKAVEILRQLVGLDFAPLTEKRNSLYAERTRVGLLFDSAKGKLAAYTLYPDAPLEEISVAELTQQLTNANAKNTENAKSREEMLAGPTAAVSDAEVKLAAAKGMNDRIALEINTLEAEIERIQKLLLEKRAQRERQVDAVSEHEKAILSAREALSDARVKVGALVDVDSQPILEKIRTADETNVKVRSNKRRAELEKEALCHNEKYNSLTKQIADVDYEKAKKLQDAKFPIPEISFDESGVLLNKMPWKQASTAEQIRASVAMGLALNPKLRVLMIREGSLLDEKSLAMVVKLAEEKDAQIWIERVSTGEECSVIISDGMVKQD